MNTLPASIAARAGQCRLSKWKSTGIRGYGQSAGVPVSHKADMKRQWLLIGHVNTAEANPGIFDILEPGRAWTTGYNGKYGSGSNIPGDTFICIFSGKLLNGDAQHFLFYRVSRELPRMTHGTAGRTGLPGCSNNRNGPIMNRFMFIDLLWNHWIEGRYMT